MRREFVAIESACRRWGGLASAEEVLTTLRQRTVDQPLSRLARWIVRRDLISLQWGATTWLPLFQFDTKAMSPSADVVPVTGELVNVFDDWELIGWYISPNTWLGGLTPIAAVKALPARVHQAARADRFIARG
jgi:hypothetical protein